MRTTNKKCIAEFLAKEAAFFLCKEQHIKLASVDKDYFSLGESEIVARFDKWADCVYWLKGYLSAKNLGRWDLK